MSELILAKNNELPSSWYMITLQDYVNIAARIGWRGLKKSEYTDTGAFLLAVKNIESDGTINFNGIKDHLSDFRYNESPEIQLKENDILVTKDGTIGKIGLITKLPKKATVNSSILVVRPLNFIFPRFLFYYFKSPFFQKIVKEKTKGTAVPHLFQYDIKNFKIHVAPLNEQKRIVGKIEELFSILDFNDRLLNQSLIDLQKYKKSIFKNFFDGTLTFDWREKNKGKVEPALELVKKIKKSKSYKKKESDSKFESNIFQKYQLPNEWAWTTIGEISNVVRGASPRPAGSTKYFGGFIPWITVKFLTADEKPYLFSTTEFVTEEGRAKSRYVETGTLLITNSGATLGVPKITKIGGCINDGIVAIEEVNYPLKNYLYYFLSGLTKRLRMINQGAAQPNLNTSIIKSIPIPLPPTSEQEEIVQLFETFSTEIMVTNDVIKNVINENRKLRSSILRKAFEGKLVPQDPNDELAEILLQKIKQEKERLEQKQKIIKVKASKRRRKNVK